MIQSQVFTLGVVLVAAVVCSASPSRNYRYVHEDSRGDYFSYFRAPRTAKETAALHDHGDDSIGRPLRSLGEEKAEQVQRNEQDGYRVPGEGSVFSDAIWAAAALVDRQQEVQPGAERPRGRARRDSIVVRPLGVTRLRDARRQQQRGTKSAKDQKSSKSPATSSRGLLKISPN
ncbi:hypothetical protein ONE63_003604 [Megalurothrips usitatus]|uniref:Secreted protein n=1 Tax=Megalurothrips usitatus TaxID=439358 RepID=A0AAV7X7T7_9NEOP|nr:hypothetical protein ONE63_003604 [Megalurothrips usitatus]